MSLPDATDPGDDAAPAHGLPAGFLLRPMTVWDVPEVLEHEETLFPLDAWPGHFYAEELAQAGPAGALDAHGRPTTRDYRVVVRQDTGEIVGYGGIMAVGDTADVQTIGTAAAVQGRGIGAAQLRWMVAAARERGAESLLLEVRESNAAARRLYARHGFEPIAVRRGYYPGGEDAVVMRRAL
ncbi:ribosomal protein S18-alanine N-acetyltransferase [Micrococcus porci]|uniref:ribosomal protein S18-alanine N-acetyltransferase n=1 Tax=Micrococcus TaxID=1269 RepID=UPI001CD015C0|nr:MULTISPECIES: ribosomal protein S18-alanine N-acetyltransferase [Micrococcus]MCG7421319.1 ribosomal protein S18-alanine N-acetyltransferase [Micrococcus sp. ACRRV]UBH25669.1 ribosomal protein S18-alanine N-acetyltransferase [Micrococcus porci]